MDLGGNNGRGREEGGGRKEGRKEEVSSSVS